MGAYWGSLFLGVLVWSGAVWGQTPLSQEEMKELVHESCPEKHIVPHTEEDLEDIIEHLGGSIFGYFSQYSSFQWDEVRFKNDFPINIPLMGFAQANGDKCLVTQGLTLTRLASGYNHAFKNKLMSLNSNNLSKAEIKTQFNQYYLKMAIKYGYINYINLDSDILNASYSE